jgi:hypothetical protein
VGKINHINALTHGPVSVRMAGRSGDHTLSSAEITSSLENDESASEFSDESEPDFTGNKSDSDNETPDDSNGDKILNAGSMTQKQITSLDWVWQTVDESFTTNKIPFTGFSRSKDSISTKIDSFLLFFDTELSDMIVEETNKYADQKIQSTMWKPQSRVKS